MGAISTITVPDAAATPVNRNFEPGKIDGDIAFYHEKTASVAAGYWKLGISLRPPLPGNGSKIYKAVVKIDMPTVVSETINGVVRTSVEYTNYATMEFSMSADSTLQARKDLRKIAHGILGHAAVVDVVENLNNIY